MNGILQDVKYAIRAMLKNPGFTLVAVLSLTVGIGANSVIFTLAKAVFLQTVAVNDPAHLIVVFSSATSRSGQQQQFLPMSYLNARDLRQSNQVFSSSSIVIPTAANLVISGKDINVFCELVSDNFFATTGVQPELGRWFVPEEDQSPGAHPVAVISHALWKRQFGGDRLMLGQTIQIGSQPFVVVGVAPDDFHDLGTFGSPDVMVPVSMHDQVLKGLQKDWFNLRGARMTYLVGRLKPGVSFAQARSEFENSAGVLMREYPQDNAGRGVALASLKDTVIPPAQHGAYFRAGVLMGVIVGLVLLIACANVANLLLARATHRRRELAIRISMGASRKRLVRQLITESFVLALIASLLGVACAFTTRGIITSLVPPGLPKNLNFRVDVTVFLFTLGIALIATLLFGLMPALECSRSDRIAALHDRTDAPTGSTRWYGLRGALVMFQVAFSLVALVGAGLFIRSLQNAQQIDPGFELKHELTIFMNLGSARYPQAKAEEFFQDVVDHLRGLPEVANASFCDHTPLALGFERTAFTANADMNDPRNGKTTPIFVVQPGFFSASGMVLNGGRDFTDHDDEIGQMVAIVNEAAARQFWPGQDPIGKHMHFLLTTWDVNVVGIVNTVKYQTLGEPPRPIIYFPLKQHFTSAMYLWVRTRTEPKLALASVRDVVQSMDPSLPLTNVRMGTDSLDQSLAAPKLGAELLTGFGLLALLLAAVGTYGVMSYLVSQRTREIGIRLALGAQRSDVLRLIIPGGMMMVGVGIVGGLCLSLFFAHSINALLYGIGIFDALSFFCTAGLLGLVALAACMIPARRAVRVDPVIALRSN